MDQVTVDLDMVSLVLGLVVVVVSVAGLVHFRKHQPDNLLLRAICVIGILAGSFRVLGQFFWRLVFAG